MTNEELTQVLTKLLQMHPELCPHTYEYQKTTVDDEKQQHRLFVCKYCGQVIDVK